MSTISSVNNSSNGWAQLSAARAANQSKMQERMLAKADTDGNGSIDSTELQTVLDRVSEKTGVTIGTSAKDLLAKADANGDGSLGAAELGQALQSVLPPPPSTMDFAQSRSSDSTTTSQASDDLFAKVDTDGNGSIDQSELASLMQAMSARHAHGADSGASDSSGTSSDTAASTATSTTADTASSDLFAKLDTDGDGKLTQAEFDAGRPSGPHGAGGMPPPPPGGMGGPGGVGGAGGASSADSTTYDPLDTNEDGVVSAAEAAAGAAASGTTSTDPLEALFKAIDTDGDQKLSASETDAFAKQVATALETMQSSASSTTGTTSDSNSNSSSDGNSNSGQQPFDLKTLAQLVLKQYEDIAKNQASTTTSTLSATA